MTEISLRKEITKDIVRILVKNIDTNIIFDLDIWIVIVSLDNKC